MRLPPNDDGRGPAVVQRVRTRWSKASRGGAAAALRNSTPIGFRLPAVDAPLLHDVVMCESQAFSPEDTTTTTLPDGSKIELRMIDGRLRVKVTPTPWGMPQRHQRPPAVNLKPQEWVRWQINYRFGLDQGWVYRLETWNVALGPVAPELFLGDPNYVVDERAHLR